MLHVRKNRKVSYDRRRQWKFQVLILVMKFGKKLKDLQSTKMIEPQAIAGINRLVCTSKSHNVELKGTLILYEIH